MYYLGRPNDAFQIMREKSIGINNIDIAKIPIGINKSTGLDSDSDGLLDIFEDAIGSDKNNPDSDDDGYYDKQELEDGYNPTLKLVRYNYDNEFAKKQYGKIILQVEQNGEAWYVYPNDGKRYFLGRPEDAFLVMKNLGLGISNDSFNQID